MTSGLSFRKWNQETNPIRPERPASGIVEMLRSLPTSTRKDQLVHWGPLPSCCLLPPANFVFPNTLAARFWAQGVDCLFQSSTFRTWRSRYCISCHPAKSDGVGCTLQTMQQSMNQWMYSKMKGEAIYNMLAIWYMKRCEQMRKVRTCGGGREWKMKEQGSWSWQMASGLSLRKMKPDDQSHHIRKACLRRYWESHCGWRILKHLGMLASLPLSMFKQGLIPRSPYVVYYQRQTYFQEEYQEELVSGWLLSGISSTYCPLLRWSNARLNNSYEELLMLRYNAISNQVCTVKTET